MVVRWSKEGRIRRTAPGHVPENLIPKKPDGTDGADNKGWKNRCRVALRCCLATPRPLSGHRVRRLMRVMGLPAIYQAPRTTTRHPQHRVDPYILKGLAIERPNQVWTADSTYIPVQRGFLCLSWIGVPAGCFPGGFCVDAVTEADPASCPRASWCKYIDQTFCNLLRRRVAKLWCYFALTPSFGE